MKDKKIVLITGANGGLGKSITESFLKSGSVVVGTSLAINDDEFNCANFFAKPAKLTDRISVENLVDSTVEDFGKIDVLVHTIGGFAGGRSIFETDDETFERMFELNARMAFYLFRAVIPLMQNAGGGRIVAIGSRAGIEPSPYSAVYGASKAALMSIIKSIAMENTDKNITANAVLPETIDTPQNRKLLPDADFSKWVSAERIAQTVLFLSTDSASDINGALIPIYGRNL